MKFYKYDIQLENNYLKQFIQRYHFEEKDQDVITALVKFLENIIPVQAFVHCKENEMICCMTLGSSFDQLEEVVLGTDNLLMAYCMECCSMEFLTKGYEKINNMIHEETGKWVGAYEFLDCDNKELENFLTEVKKCKMEHEIVRICNGMLHPMKSVVFKSILTETPTKESCHDCQACKNLNCEFRKRFEKRRLDWESKRKNLESEMEKVQQKQGYSYGVSQILGGGRIR